MRYGFLLFPALCTILAMSGCSTDSASEEKASRVFRCGEDGNFETINIAYSDKGETAVLSMAGETHQLALEESDGGLVFSKGDLYLWAQSRDADFVEVEDELAHRNCHAQEGG